MNSPGLRFVGAALIMLLGIWAGSRLYWVRNAQYHRGVPVPAGQASVPDPRDASPDAPGSAVPHAVVPDLLPAFALSDLSGKPTSVSTWNGKSLVINFWATWCAPCRREMPLLETLASEWADRGIVVVGVAVDYPDKVKEFAGRFNIDYPLLVGEQDALDVAAKLGMNSPAFPFTVFADRSGEIVALFVGELHRPQADLILSVVQNLNQNRIQLPEAKQTIARGLAKLAEQASG
jgi:thiol-disulfide isomerase/thioredoxin